jgi:hypothetical protein
MNDYKDDINQDNNKEVSESNRSIDTNANRSGSHLDKQTPQKKHFNVLHEDGSFADLPDKEINGAGAQSASITE